MDRRIAADIGYKLGLVKLAADGVQPAATPQPAPTPTSPMITEQAKRLEEERAKAEQAAQAAITARGKALRKPKFYNIAADPTTGKKIRTQVPHALWEPSTGVFVNTAGVESPGSTMLPTKRRELIGGGMPGSQYSTVDVAPTYKPTILPVPAQQQALEALKARQTAQIKSTPALGPAMEQVRQQQAVVNKQKELLGESPAAPQAKPETPPAVAQTAPAQAAAAEKPPEPITLEGLPPQPISIELPEAAKAQAGAAPAAKSMEALKTYPRDPRLPPDVDETIREMVTSNLPPEQYDQFMAMLSPYERSVAARYGSLASLSSEMQPLAQKLYAARASMPQAGWNPYFQSYSPREFGAMAARGGFWQPTSDEQGQAMQDFLQRVGFSGPEDYLANLGAMENAQMGDMKRALQYRLVNQLINRAFGR